MERRPSLTAPYALVQAAFWMSVCVAIGFAAVYLQELGYTNTQLGIILAAGNTLGALLGPGLSARIDADRRVTAAHYVPPVLAVQAVALLLLALFPAKGVVTTLAFTVYIAFCLSVNSLILKLYVDADHGGAELSFSFARGIGSLAYVLLSAVLGPLVARFSARTIPYVGLALCVMQFFFCRNIARALPAPDNAAGAAQGGSSMREFVRRYPHFCVVLLGMILVFFAHNVFANFMINVTRNVGGDTETMGYLNAFMAATEIPVMLLFHRVRGKRSSFFFLRVAYIVFSLKLLAITLAPNVPLLFAAMLLQGPSFGLYAACTVDYVGEVVPFEDSAKAQSLSFSMTTVGSVFASVIAGRLYDVASVTTTLGVGTVICFVGTIIVLLGLKSEKAWSSQKRQPPPCRHGGGFPMFRCSQLVELRFHALKGAKALEAELVAQDRTRLVEVAANALRTVSVAADRQDLAAEVAVKPHDLAAGLDVRELVAPARGVELDPLALLDHCAQNLRDDVPRLFKRVFACRIIAAHDVEVSEDTVVLKVPRDGKELLIVALIVLVLGPALHVLRRVELQIVHLMDAQQREVQLAAVFFKQRVVLGDRVPLHAELQSLPERDPPAIASLHLMQLLKIARVVDVPVGQSVSQSGRSWIVPVAHHAVINMLRKAHLIKPQLNAALDLRLHRRLAVKAEVAVNMVIGFHCILLLSRAQDKRKNHEDGRDADGNQAHVTYLPFTRRRCRPRWL